MSGTTDPRWPRLLSLAAHEFRSPLTVVGGYIRMLLKERAGPVSDQQRKLLEEAEKSCARLSSLLGEISELAHLESGTAPFNRTALDLTGVLTEVIAAMPELQDRTVTIGLVAGDSYTVHGDATRLRSAFGSILSALRRELVTSDQLTVRTDVAEDDGHPLVRITIGESIRIDQLAALTPPQMTTFDEWRGGNGLALATARRTIESHGGRIWSPADNGKAGAVLTLPIAQ